jgi:hypothetical protein
MDDQPSNLAGRLKDLEHFTGALVGGREQVPDHEPKTMPISKTCIPVPRRSRVFLRTGDGHGAFADLTLTAPHPRVALD